MARRRKLFKVDTQPTKQVVVESLTRDATVEACLFDLIDNSIDAARETYFGAALAEESVHQLPDSYEGFNITLAFSGTDFRIEDNCGGISVEQLKKMVMRFGQRSAHELGIGAFGVGLNRALFKLGRVSHLKTDTGTERAELVLNTNDYLKSEGWELPAEEFQSSGASGTSVEIRKLPTEVSRQFANADWLGELRDELGSRYGRFVAKGLRLSVNDIPVVDNEVRLREDGPYEDEYKYYKTEDGVAIHIRYGQHELHRFTFEADYEADRNRKITDEYGWTVLCNDRAILMCDRTYKTGWDGKFHTEFYGFVGFVNFVGPEPASLPWHTTKTDVDLNDPAYQMALSDMRVFAEKWRKFATQRKKRNASPPSPVPPRADGSRPSGDKPATIKTVTRPRARKEPVPRPVTKDDHNQFRTVLPEDIDERYCFDKQLALVHEAKRHDLVADSYSGLALIRMLFESTIAAHLDRHGRYGELVTASIARHEKKITMPPEHKKNFVPTMEDMLSWLTQNPSVWGVAKANHLKHSLSKMSAHKKTMNSALHNPFQQIHRSEALQIRDEVLPMLRHLIEN